MSTVTYEGFEKWVDDQHPDTMIDHESTRTCAIGLYITCVHGELQLSDHYQQFSKLADSVPNPEVRKILNNSVKGKKHAPTYGKLSDLLKEKNV